MNPSAGDFPITQNQFWNGFNQGTSGILNAGQFAQIPSQIKGQNIQNALNQYMVQKAAAESPYYGKMALAQLQQAQAQPQATLAGAGLSRAQANEINTLLPYETQSKKIAVQQATLANNLLRSVLGQGNNNNNQTTPPNNIQNSPINAPPQLNNASNIAPNSAFQSMTNPISSQIANIQNKQPMQNQPSPQLQNTNGSNPLNTNNMSYAQSALVSKLLGLPAPNIQQVPGTGQLSAITAFGNIPVAQGLNAEQEARQKGFGEQDAKAYGSAVEAATGFQNQNVALDNLISLANDPNVGQVSGPIGSFFTKWIGNAHNKQLLGGLMTSSGEIALQIAPSIKGSLTQGNLGLIGMTKANPLTDFKDVLFGKAKAQKLINNVLDKRAELQAYYIRHDNMSADEALDKAAKETPLEPFRKQIEQLINPPQSSNQFINSEDAIKQRGFVIMNKKDNNGNVNTYHIPADVYKNQMKDLAKAGYNRA